MAKAVGGWRDAIAAECFAFPALRIRPCVPGPARVGRLCREERNRKIIGQENGCGGPREPDRAGKAARIKRLLGDRFQEVVAYPWTG